jgi:hypothetical protein
MQNFNDLKKWLKNGVSEDPLMLHGTSIETIFELADTSRLPSGIAEVHEGRVLEDTRGHLYFTPVTSKFKGRKYDELGWIDKDRCIEKTKDYAERVGRTGYLASKFKCQTEEFYTILNSWSCEFLSWKEIQTELRKRGFELSLRQIGAIDSNARKRKGVIVEPKKSILELPHKVAEDDYSAISAECPNGLDKRYVKGIELLGPTEVKLIQRFLDGKLRYEGFRTEFH